MCVEGKCDIYFCDKNKCHIYSVVAEYSVGFVYTDRDVEM